ncbi:MAG: hypothetical protein PHN66_03115 [Candidatus Shapirobacteria bacterium]|nr:hypothetical protein [Candidatus Shapirobacteria bacterium]
MIGNPKWFNPRKYTGWGLTPNCWQGWAYIFGFLLPIAIINSISINQNIKNIFTFVWTGLLLIDFVHLMSQIKRDERDRLHEALSDRNALWFMLTVLAVGMIYQAANKITFNTNNIDPVILIALLGGTLVKAVSQFYFRDK